MNPKLTHFLFFILLSFFCIQNLQAQKPDVDLTLGKGLSITAADSTVKVNIKGSFRTLYQGSGILNTEDSWSHNMLFQTVRINMQGWALNPKIRYQVQFGFAPVESAGNPTNPGSSTILDAYLHWDFHPNMGVSFGQKRSPGSREFLVSLFSVGLTNRSLLHLRMNADRDVGVQFHSRFGNEKLLFKSMAEISKGEGRNILTNNSGGLKYSLRLDLLPLGDFRDDFSFCDFKGYEKPKLALGVAFTYNQNATRSRGQIGEFTATNTDLMSLFADFLFKYQGFTLLGEFVNKQSPNLEDGQENRFGTGNSLNLHAGYLLGKQSELHLRYTLISPDETSSLIEENVYTAGWVYYFKNHAFKVVNELSLIQEEGRDDLILSPGVLLQLIF